MLRVVNAIDECGVFGTVEHEGEAQETLAFDTHDSLRAMRVGKGNEDE